MKAILRFAGWALIAILLGPTALPQSSLLPPEKSWALAASAILAQRNGDRHDLLEGRPRTPQNIAYGVDLLQSSWGVNNRAKLLSTMRSLQVAGNREDFANEARNSQALAAYYAKFGSRSILAWNYMRYISLCRWGYLAGYFSEQEAWNHILPAARLLQQTFSSWQEMGRDFLVGREFWSPEDERQAETEYVYYRLVRDPQSPWRRLPWNLDLGEGAPPMRGKSTASLDLIARPRGLTCLVLEVIDRPNVELIPAMEQSLGCKLRILSDKANGPDRILRAECNQESTGPQREVKMRYALEPLAAALRKLDVDQLFVFTGHYVAGASEILPAAANHWIRDGYLYYEQAYDLDNPVPALALRYGFAVGQVFRVYFLCSAFFGLIVASTLAFRRTLLHSSASAEEGWTRFEKTESRLALAIWFCWPAILVYGNGLPILRLAIGGEESIGTVAAALLAITPLFAVQAISAALLAPVYWKLRGIEATRSQIVRAALWRTAIWTPAAAHALALADPLHRVDAGTLVVLFAVAQALEFVLYRKWLSATGAQGTAIVGGPLKTRISDLAFEMKSKIRQVYLIPDGPWKWRQLYSVGDGSIAIPAAAIGTLSRDEMDAAVVRQIAWLRMGNDRKLMMMRSAGALAVFLAGYAINGWLRPFGTILFVRYWWIVVERLIAREVWRMERKADTVTLRTLRAPESLITSIVKLDRLRLHTPDAASKKRLEFIAKQAELDEIALQALMQPLEATADRYPAPELNRGELVAVVA